MALTGKRLVAYVVPIQEDAKGTSLTVSELRHFLLRKLPEYMIPPVFVQLQVLPLTPNGKINRQALPTLDQTRPELGGATFVAPRTLEEEVLAGIWLRVLGVEQVGIDDDYFALGGGFHS